MPFQLSFSSNLGSNQVSNTSFNCHVTLVCFHVGHGIPVFVFVFPDTVIFEGSRLFVVQPLERLWVFLLLHPCPACSWGTILHPQLWRPCHQARVSMSLSLVTINWPWAELIWLTSFHPFQLLVHCYSLSSTLFLLNSCWLKNSRKGPCHYLFLLSAAWTTHSHFHALGFFMALKSKPT